MSDIERLRNRFLAACAASPLLACASPTTGVARDGGTVFTPSRIAACDTWIQGRVDRWCATPNQANELAAPGASERACPTRLDPKLVRTEKTFPRSSRLGRGKVYLLRATTAQASKSCAQSLCCYLWVNERRGVRRFKMKGRPLIDRCGQALRRHPHPVTRNDTTRLKLPLESLAPAVVARAREHWLEAASWEHASITSFLRCAEELRSLGAPPRLIDATVAAARDESCHAAIALQVAAALAHDRVGYDLGPPPTARARTVTYASLARAVFVEGCIGESAAAMEACLASHASRRCGQTEIADALWHIADDETRHAELAWATLAWLVQEGGEAVRREIAGAVEAMDDRPSVAAGPEPYELDASALGCLSSPAQKTNFETTWRVLTRPMALQLISRPAGRSLSGAP